MHLVLLGTSSATKVRDTIKGQLDSVTISVFPSMHEFVSAMSLRRLQVDRLIFLHDALAKEPEEGLEERLRSFADYFSNNQPAARMVSILRSEEMTVLFSSVFISPLTVHLHLPKVTPMAIVDLATLQPNDIRKRYGVSVNKQIISTIDEVYDPAPKAHTVPTKASRKEKKKGGIFGLFGKNKKSETEEKEPEESKFNPLDTGEALVGTSVTQPELPDVELEYGQAPEFSFFDTDAEPISSDEPADDWGKDFDVESENPDLKEPESTDIDVNSPEYQAFIEDALKAQGLEEGESSTTEEEQPEPSSDPFSSDESFDDWGSDDTFSNYNPDDEITGDEEPFEWVEDEASEEPLVEEFPSEEEEPSAEEVPFEEEESEAFPPSFIEEEETSELGFTDSSSTDISQDFEERRNRLKELGSSLAFPDVVIPAVQLPEGSSLHSPLELEIIADEDSDVVDGDITALADAYAEGTARVVERVVEVPVDRVVEVPVEKIVEVEKVVEVPVEKIVEVEKVIKIADRKKSYKNGVRTIIVTGDRKTGVTGAAINMAAYYGKTGRTLYVDFDIKRKGSLLYLGLSEIAEQEEKVQSGLSLLKNVNSLSHLTYIHPSKGFEALLTVHGVMPDTEQLLEAQRVLASQRTYKTLIIDCPFENLHLLQDMLIYSEIIICVESNVASVLNTLLELSTLGEDSRIASFLFNNSQYCISPNNTVEEFHESMGYLSDLFSLDNEEVNWAAIPVVGSFSGFDKLLEAF